MEKMVKVFSVVLILIMVLLTLSTTVNAFVSVSEITPTSPSDSKWNELISKVLGIVQIIGYGVAVVTLTIVGIKYMVGSPADKAEYKKSLVPYVVGAVILFAASAIVTVFYNIIK